MKQSEILTIQVVMLDGTTYTLKHPEKQQDLFLVSMPPEFGGHGIGVWVTEKGAKNFIEHIYDDSLLRFDKELWEKLHGVEVSKHTIRKISGSSVMGMVISLLNQELDDILEEEHSDQNRTGSDSKT